MTCIGLTGVGNDPGYIAGYITGMINKGRGSLRIKAIQNGSTIKLEGIGAGDVSSGKSGNQPIKTTGNHGFTVEHMTGGIGCDINASCNQDSDCASKQIGKISAFSKARSSSLARRLAKVTALQVAKDNQEGEKEPYEQRSGGLATISQPDDRFGAMGL